MANQKVGLDTVARSQYCAHRDGMSWPEVAALAMGDADMVIMRSEMLKGSLSVISSMHCIALQWIQMCKIRMFW